MEFLGKIAKAFSERERESLSDFCFVFPGRRAALFFQRELAGNLVKPIFSPSLITISDLFSSLSGLKRVDNLECVFRLYNIYCSLVDNPESFDDFIFWGETLISDFDDTDKFLADPKRLFANIKDLKELDADYSFLSDRQLKAIKTFWSNFHNGEESIKKSKFKALWSLMLPMYVGLKNGLEHEGLGYEGMIYRKIAQDIQSGNSKSADLFLKRYKGVVFIGFNALNECEKRLMNYIKLSGKGDFYWDYFGNILTDPDNRASLFMRGNLQSFPSSLNIDFNNFSLPQTEVIGTPSAIGQAKIAGEIASEFSAGLKNAVILPDESLLTSVVRSFDYSEGEINITMGYPLRDSAVVSLVENLVELQSSAGLYFRRVLSILRHSYVKGYSAELVQKMEREIVSGSMIYVPESLFSEDPFLKIIFRKVISESNSKLESLALISDYILEILEYIVNKTDIGKFEKELIYYYHTLVVRLKGLALEISPSTFLRLLKQLANSTSVPFKGEPLAGLQIMGMLEARCLDFENVIICSVNEGILPSANINTSYIPLNLRKAFSLPDNEYADAVSAYNFYRIVLRSKRVWLLYDTRNDGISNGEKSRFILQMKYHYRAPIVEYLSAGSVSRRIKSPIVVNKSGTVRERLEEYAKGRRSFSASSLSQYISCPLKFYFYHIERINEEDELSESVEARTFGTVLHKSIARLYETYEGRIADQKSLLALLNNGKLIDQVIESEFKRERKINEIKGYNYLVCSLIGRYIKKIVNYDLKLAPFKYIKAEEEFIHELIIDENRGVRLKSYIDRLDKLDGKLRIVDYKTGGKPDKFPGIAELFIPNQSKNHSVYFQLYLYSLIVAPNERSILAPYILRDLEREYELETNPDEIEYFKNQLIELIKEILNFEVPFIQTSSLDSCKMCPFKEICR